jgi:brefeldin A-inhibited guanine nucleotide-exchange protein
MYHRDRSRTELTTLQKEIEVFLNEIYLALLERRNAPVLQKAYFMGILLRFCADPRALVETYLNYDCDRNVDNMFQTLIEDLSKAASAPVMVTPLAQQQYDERVAKGAMNSSGTEWQARGTLPPSLTTGSMSNHNEINDEIPREYIIKRQALDCLVEVLRSLVNWSQQGIADITGGDADGRQSEDFRESIDPSMNDSSSRILNGDTPIPPSTPVLDDDPEQLEKEKAQKTAMSKAINQFNFKPKRGIKTLIAEGFIPSDSPQDIAHFLLTEDRLDKAQIGEFLGEGDEHNIAIMHAFVDQMDFTKRRFVDALREFLQSFRLPGEAQKIDRFMLKFANRYVTGNPNAFANADTAYVLSYSVIMLNTDQHSVKIAKQTRMTKEDFIKNNRGINDNADLPDEYLIGIYDEIAHNEIVLKSEREAAAAMGATPQPSGGLASALATVGRDLQRESYLQQSEEISHRSEQLFKNLFRNQRKNATKAGAVKFIPATSFKHVGPMFDVTWMSFFSGLSGQMQNAHNLEIIKLCMEGMKLAIRIACLFDLETPREAFVSALKNSTNLNNPTEVMAKNVEALKVLLEIAQTEGNLLKESWRDILMCVSQLDRLQLISDGVDEGSIPDVSRARIVPPSRTDTGSSSRKSSQSVRPPRPRPRSTTTSTSYSVEIAMESRSDEVIKGVDRIFTNTANLSGDAIVHFVRALTEVSWEEIKISGSNESPRTYSLQKLVEISYYNMTRVRFEWTNIWLVLGEHFNRVSTHNNTAVVFFALDSLRQLSMRFMEIEELPGFQFQKDFLKPFKHVIENSSVVTVKDMALRCLIQMIQARGENIRSGWRTMFGVFTVAAREQYESIVNLAFDNVNQIYQTRFGMVISQGAFADLIVCLTEFSKNMKFQKKSLQAMETLKSIIPKMLKTPECPLSNKARADVNSDGTIKSEQPLTAQPSRTSQEETFWFPVLFAFHDVLMTGEDLEVRSNALNYLFDSLIKYGGDFPPDFWDILWRQLLYPIFMVLKSKSEMSNVLNHEELSVWLSTTMIQALRNMITLFTHYFESLESMLDRWLDLLALCICQENDTIARIGSNCLQQLILQNVAKFQPEHWSKIVGAFVELFERTTAYQLFSAATSSTAGSLENGAALMEEPLGDDKSLKINGASGPATSDNESINDDEARTPPAQGSELEDYKPQSGLQQQPVVVTAARRRFFNKIITRCVLQLLMIETVNELFSNDAVYAQIPSPELLRLMALLKKSFLFAKKFNENKDLRMRLWREGFMKQPPNLLKQESGSAATYVSILLRMYHDENPERKSSRAETENALVPLCADIIRGFTELEEESQQRNIMAWRPVVVDVLEGYTNFPREGFEKYVEVFYPLGVELLGREMGVEVRVALQGMLRRVGEVKLGLPAMMKDTTPTSPTNTNFAFRSRRSSKQQ